MNEQKDLEDKVKTVKKILKVNNAKALGVAVILTVNTTLTIGCAKSRDSYIAPQGYTAAQTDSSSSGSGGGSTYHGGGYHGGGYYYYRGGTYKGGTWGSGHTTFGNGAGTSTYRGGGTGGIGG